MNSLEKQFTNLILSNVPNNLALPINEDYELQTTLAQILELLKDTNIRIQALEYKLFRLKNDLKEKNNIYGE